jgi:hypothetical protein
MNEHTDDTLRWDLRRKDDHIQTKKLLAVLLASLGLWIGDNDCGKVEG